MGIQRFYLAIGKDCKVVAFVQEELDGMGIDSKPVVLERME